MLPVIIAVAWAAVVGAATPSQYLLRLCDEKDRLDVEKAIGEKGVVARRLTHLPSVPLVVVEGLDDLDAVRALPGVCALDASRRTRIVDRVSRKKTRASDGGRASRGEWGDYFYGLSHPEGVPWNLDRINAAGDLDGDASRFVHGAGASIFVLDSGLDASHAEFAPVAGGARREVENVADFTRGRFGWRNKEAWGWTDVVAAARKANNDVDGHGTHCAGTAGGRTMGLATAANVYGMKVLENDGEGSLADELAALDAIAELVETGTLAGPVVASLSVGGACTADDAAYCAFDDVEARAIADLRALGVGVVVAAGNEYADACYREGKGQGPCPSI